MKKVNKNIKPPEPLKARIVFDGSNGGQTRSFCCALAKTGQLGKIAAELFRIQKTSDRAKVYSGGIKSKYGSVSFRTLAYKRKGVCLSVLCKLLQADACGLTWGWGYDGTQQFAKCVLYVDLPNGQVSFHSTDRYAGPKYQGEWDGEYKSEQRILSLCDQLLKRRERKRRKQSNSERKPL
jgi:hypothetical protein